MYSLLTSAALFFILSPGVVLTLPPGGSPLVAGLVHAIAFYAIQAFLSEYIPWWAIWVVAGIVLIGKFYMGRSSTPTYSSF
jgi:hypothetical protein